MNAYDVFDRPIAFQRSFVSLTGSINAALMLSQAVYWSRRCTDGWFYKTQGEWQEETGLTRTEQETARKNLRAKGFIEEKKRGVPCKVYYNVRMKNILAAYGLLTKASLQVSCILDGGITADKAAGILPTITETTQRLRREAVARVFNHYIETFDKNKKLYSFTDKRKEKGMLRLEDCLKKVDNDLAKAEELMTIAVDNLASSKWHTGKHSRNSTPYIDWIDNLFKSTEELEKWLTFEEADRG